MRPLVLVLLASASTAAAQARVPIFLSLRTEPRMQVSVIPADAPGKRVPLGETPFDRVPGLFVGDTLVLQNEGLCLTDELPLLYGEPGEHKIVERVYRQGILKLTLRPTHPRSLFLFCSGFRVGASNLPVLLYEGAHRLELRGDSLKAPMPFEVKIEKDKVTTLSLAVEGPARPAK